ncbi:MAG: glycerate kinase [Chloroflexi bacterium]|nr:glycerate kinase [Chloroflexota bacterium]
MKLVISPGAFKHSLSAAAVAQAIAAGLTRSGLGADLVLLPIADGGNGTLDAFLVGGGQRITRTVRDPLGRPIEAAFGLLSDQTAVIEMALASGLELLRPDELDPLAATTYGTGQLMQAALDAGAKRVIVGMGGSATVDGGAGCLQALGVKLLEANGAEISPGGGHLRQSAQLDTSGLDPRWAQTEVIIASDVDNPALGPDGAAAVFGPQKGASPTEVALLEANLHHFFTLVNDQLGVDVRSARGGGAAGAFSAGLMAFLGGQIQPGIDLILEQLSFDEHLRDADLVITGEGQMDAQTVHGKGPIGVARRARERGVPTVALVGGLDADDALLHEAGLWAVLSVVDKPMPLQTALDHAAELVERAALRLGYLLRIGTPGQQNV